MYEKKRPVATIEIRDWRSSLVELARKGGVFAKAYRDAAALAYELQEDLNAWRRQNLTNNGCQIAKSIKIDLPGRARMVFVVDADCVILLFAGDHESVDRWCDKNASTKFSADPRGRLAIVKTDPPPRDAQKITYSAKPLIQLLPQSERDGLLRRLPKLQRKFVESLAAECTDSDIDEATESLSDLPLASLLSDVLVELRADEVPNAIARIQQFEGTLRPIEEVRKEGINPIPGAGMTTLPKVKKFYEDLLEHYAKSSNLRDWMLLLHPDQESIVDAHLDGPSLLFGISGSGKTCVLVRRAMRLAERYPEGRSLIVTLNRPLAELLKQLVADAAPESIRSRIDVKSFYELCRTVLETCDPAHLRQYLEVADATENHVDDVWREFYQCETNNNDARVLEPIHDSLIARGVDAEGYVREEFDLIRSIAPLQNREKYLEADRVGRVHPLNSAWRKRLLEGLASWERKCWTVGVMDSLGMAVAVHRFADQIVPQYRCILVDESQDFGTVELDLVRRLAEDGTDNLILAGDLAQKISLKSRRLMDIGIEIPYSRRLNLTLNYRNSREILEVASKMLLSAVPQENRQDSDFVFIDPESSAFSGPAPRLLREETLEDELSAAIAYGREVVADRSSANVCIAIAGFSEHEVKHFSERTNVPMLRSLDSLTAGAVFLSDLESTKGFEFSQMIVVNLTKGDFPSPRCPAGEEWRDACRLYVAMTRPRTELILSYHGELSPLVDGIRGQIREHDWCEYVDEDRESLGFPQRLDEFRWDSHGAVERIPLRNCSATQFLFRKQARGLDVELIGRLRQLVTGSRRTLNGEVREWATLGDLIDDIADSPAARRVAGAATVEGLRRLAAESGLHR